MSDIKCRFGFLKKHGVFIDLDMFLTNIMQWFLDLHNTHGPEITCNQMCNKPGLDNTEMFFFFTVSLSKPQITVKLNSFWALKNLARLLPSAFFFLLWSPDHRNIRQDAALVVRLMKSRGFFLVMLDWFV